MTSLFTNSDGTFIRNADGSFMYDSACCCEPACLDCATLPNTITIDFGTWTNGGGWQGNSYTLTANGTACCYELDSGPCGCMKITACIVNSGTVSGGLQVAFTAEYPGGLWETITVTLAGGTGNDCKAKCNGVATGIGYGGIGTGNPACTWLMLFMNAGQVTLSAA